MKTADLIGKPLDWAVAKAEGVLYPKGDVRLLDGRLFTIEPGDYETPDRWSKWSPSEDRNQSGPIAEEELIELSVSGTSIDGLWIAKSPAWHATSCGPTPSIASMRCFVQSRLGSEVDIPAELL